MRKRPMILALLLLPLALVACGLLQEPEEASSTIEAIPIEIETPDEGEPTAMPDPTEPAAEPTEAAYPAPTEPVVEAPDAYPAPDESAAVGLQVFQISQDDSLVRFQLDEDLRGSRNTVIGETDQVAGELAIDLNDLSSAQVGVMQINARTLATDNNFRNRAIQNEILNTGAYEFITFTPTAIEGLPAVAAIGEEVTFTVTGDLTIRDITQPVVFTVTATAVSESQISGTASAVVMRGDYNLNIPSVPNVANVEEEVELSIDFVANRT
jgi:polyisoprenoid-binding protein YceI